MSLRKLTARAAAALMQMAFAVAFHCLRFVPEKLALLPARPIGCLVRLGAKRRVQAAVHLVLGGGSFSEHAFDAFWRAHTRHVGLCVIEPVYFYWISDAELLRRVDIEGEEHLRGAFGRGRGAILFVNHLGNPGAIVAGLGMRNHDVTIAGNRMDAVIGGEQVALNSIEDIVQRMFRRGRVKRALLGEQLPRQLAETLGRNGAFAMFVDFPVVQKHCRQVSFGRAAMTVNLGPALLAVRHRAEVLPVTCVRTGRNRHRLKIHPPLRAHGQTGLEERATALMQEAMNTLSEEVRDHADQWWPWVWAPVSAK